MHGQQVVHTYNRDYVSIIKLNQELPNYKEQFGIVEINLSRRSQTKFWVSKFLYINWKSKVKKNRLLVYLKMIFVRLTFI